MKIRKERMSTVSFQVPRKQADILDTIVDINRVSMAEVLRDALNFYIETKYPELIKEEV